MTDRRATLSYVYSRAAEVFGDPERGSAWLERPNRAFDDRAPLELLETEHGAHLVVQVLGRIEHGIAG
ncbi:MbcA/ParS/Xre antitoxin family protein [Natronocella acetinitrilica]|uniref:MbcA/ParS/Xre antitoxin family protein n=1 Tax=Natronocella acetinitrilica TaxID=414046 RepID=UPI00344CA9D3